MPWDNSLNADLKRHNYHCIETAHFPKEDDQKISMKTPKSIRQGIRRIVENELGKDIPTQHQISQDCDRNLRYMSVVYKNRGKNCARDCRLE